MTVGKTEYGGLGVPLHGEFEITQTTLGTDIMTITGVASQTGDFIVCRNSSGTEKFVVDKNGAITGDYVLASGGYLGFSSIPTTAATTGITKGDFFVIQTSSFMQLAVAQTANTVRYVATTSGV